MRTRWIAATLVATVVAAGAAVAVVATQESSDPQFCEGLGIMGPEAATPDAALAVVLRQHHGRLDDWKRDDERKVASGNEAVDFVPKHTPVRPAYSRITVTNEHTTWHADGACVAPREE